MLVKSRTEVASRREAILDVAEDMFAQRGYGGVSMSAIAARLGGSKATLYNYFKSKNALFEAYVARHCERSRATMFAAFAAEEELPAALAAFGHALLAFTLSDFTIRNFRIIIAEAARSPSMGLAVHEAGPAAGIGELALRLAEAAEQGAITVPDPLMAAHQFVGLAQNRLLRARLCGVVSEPTPAEIEREVTAAVATFMAAFGSEPT